MDIFLVLWIQDIDIVTLCLKIRDYSGRQIGNQHFLINVMFDNVLSTDKSWKKMLSDDL